MSDFPEAKARAARQGVSLDADQREAVEAGEPYTVTLEVTLDLSRFIRALRGGDR